MIGLRIPPKRKSPEYISPRFSDRDNDILPRQCTISQKIVFGLVVPNITPEIKRAGTHLKPVTRAKQFSGLEILWMHDQYDFGWFGMISMPQTLVR